MSPYIQSLRPRTLPLSMSGIILGTGLAGWCNWLVFAFAICTTLSLQILSNLSNELGDTLKGTDLDQHGREAYGLQAGKITIKQIKGMIVLFIALSVIFGSALIYSAFGSFLTTQSLVFFALGLFAIIGAMTYTLGKHSYGYKGLGDLGVLIFFGLVSTWGSYYLQTQSLNFEVLCSGIAIGLPSVGVLNLNNVRDMDNDRAHGKRTFASFLGKKGGKIYHTFLLTTSLVLLAVWGHLWCLVIVPLWAYHLWFIWTHEDSSFDRQMPVLMLSTLVVAALGWL